MRCRYWSNSSTTTNADAYISPAQVFDRVDFQHLFAVVVDDFHRDFAGGWRAKQATGEPGTKNGLASNGERRMTRTLKDRAFCSVFCSLQVCFSEVSHQQLELESC